MGATTPWRVGNRWLSAGATALAALLPSVSGASQDPWVVTTPVTVTAPMEVGDVIVTSGGVLTVSGVPEPGLRLTGNLLAVGTGRVELTDSVVQVLSAYHGQFAVVAAEHASITVSGCDYRVPAGVQHALVASGDAGVEVSRSTFGSVQLLANVRGRVTAAELDGEFEVILQDDARVELTDIPRSAGKGALWVWPTFGDGARAVYSPPLPGTVAAWTFPPEGSSGIVQSASITRCEVRLWPMLIRPGSDVTLRDVAAQNWVVVGLELPTSVQFTGLVNGRYVEAGTLALNDRRVTLERATVDTWNLYPEQDAEVVVRDSVIGELIAFDRSRAFLERTIVDGSGGYFGAEGTSAVNVEGGSFTCTVQVSDDATLAISRSALLPYPADPTGAYTRFGAFDRGRLLLVQTPTSTTAAAGGSGVIAFAALANPPLMPPAGTLALEGTVASFSLDEALLPQRWRIEAWTEGAPAPLVLGEGEGNVQNASLGSWTGADPSLRHELRAVLTDASGRSHVAVWPVDRARLPRKRVTMGGDRAYAARPARAVRQAYEQLRHAAAHGPLTTAHAVVFSCPPQSQIPSIALTSSSASLRGSHAGVHCSSTEASVTPGSVLTVPSTAATISGPSGQNGVVSVMITLTAPPAVISTLRIKPRSTIEMAISGSTIGRRASRTNFSVSSLIAPPPRSPSS